MKSAISAPKERRVTTGKRYGKNYLVRKTFAILRSFREVDECLTSRDLARRAQIPKSSGHRIVSTLEEIGALARGPQGYQPGFLLAALALSVDVHQALRCLCRDILEEMAFRLKVRLEISVLQDGLVHCVAQAPGSPNRGHSDDSHLDPFGSAQGKVLLAGLAAERLERLLSANQTALRWPGLQSERIRQELAIVRAQGFAVGNGRAKDLWCLAVPVSDRNGRVIAALTAQGETNGFPSNAMDEIRMQLLAAADIIRARINPVDRPEEDQD